MKPLHIFTEILLAIALITSVTSCSTRPQYRVLNGMLHTPYSVKYEATESYDDEIRDLLQAYYHSINPFDSTSIISRVNRNEAVVTDSIFRSVFTVATQVAQNTDGALDVTCSPLINLWGFGFTDDSTSITQANIDSILTFVGYEKVHIDSAGYVQKMTHAYNSTSRLSATDVVATS